MTHSTAPLEIVPAPAPALAAAPRPAGTARRFGASRTVLALLLREMSTTYGRSPGGYLWAVVEPVAVIVMLSLAFSLLLRTPSLGTSFILFYATGYLPLKLFRDLADRTAKAVRFSRPLLTYPKVTYMHAILARFLLQLLTQLMVFAIVFGGILLILDTRAAIDVPPILLSILMSAVLGLGVGAMNCFLMGIMPLWERLWSILTRPLLFVSCVFYTLDELPPKLQDVLWFNPIVHNVAVMRMGFYSTYDPLYVAPAYVFGIGLVLLAFGLLLLRRYHLDLLAK